MRKLFLLNILFFSLFTVAYADQIQKPAKPFVKDSDGSSFYFIMIDEKFHFEDGRRIQDSPAFGKVYELLDDGSSKEICTVTGWYSTVILSHDGQYLIRIGSWGSGHEPRDEHLALAFYKNCNEIARYSTKDLIRDKNSVIRTSSHYIWIAEESYSKINTEYPKLDLYTFYIKTVENIVYVFNCKTGEIINVVEP